MNEWPHDGIYFKEDDRTIYGRPVTDVTLLADQKKIISFDTLTPSDNNIIVLLIRNHSNPSNVR